jgi:DNA-binding XRE family transcriptional regulator
MKSIHPDYPALIKEVRRQLAISQEDLARELGVSYATVNRWENGQAKPSKLARAQLPGCPNRECLNYLKTLYETDPSWMLIEPDGRFSQRNPE